MSLEQFVTKADKVHNNKYDYSNSVYINNKTKLDILCTKCNVVFSVVPNSHLDMKTGCPTCAEHGCGWSRSTYIERAKKYNNKAKLYILKCFNEYEEFHKVGITMKTVKQRYSKKILMPYKYETILLLEGEAGQIWDLEKKLHNQLSNLSYKPNLSFTGETECFVGLSEEFIKTLNVYSKNPQLG